MKRQPRVGAWFEPVKAFSTSNSVAAAPRVISYAKRPSRVTIHSHHHCFVDLLAVVITAAISCLPLRLRCCCRKLFTAVFHLCNCTQGFSSGIPHATFYFIFSSVSIGFASSCNACKRYAEAAGVWRQLNLRASSNICALLFLFHGHVGLRPT